MHHDFLHTLRMITDGCRLTGTRKSPIGALYAGTVNMAANSRWNSLGWPTSRESGKSWTGSILKSKSVTGVEQITGILTRCRSAEIIHLDFVDELKSIPKWHTEACAGADKEIVGSKSFMRVEKLCGSIPEPLIITGRLAAGHIFCLLSGRMHQGQLQAFFTLIGVVIKIGVYIISGPASNDKLRSPVAKIW